MHKPRRISGGDTAIIQSGDPLLLEHARIDDTVSNDLIDLYALCATSWLEEMMGISFLPSVYVGKVDALPDDGAPIELIICPAVEPSADNEDSEPVFKYVDTSGVEHTLVRGTDYLYDWESEPARILLINGTKWMQTRKYLGASFQWKSGYPDIDSVPVKFKMMAILLITWWIENKTPAMPNAPKEMPVGWSIRSQILNNRVTH